MCRTWDRRGVRLFPDVPPDVLGPREHGGSLFELEVDRVGQSHMGQGGRDLGGSRAQVIDVPVDGLLVHLHALLGLALRAQDGGHGPEQIRVFLRFGIGFGQAPTSVFDGLFPAFLVVSQVGQLDQHWNSPLARPRALDQVQGAHQVLLGIFVARELAIDEPEGVVQACRDQRSLV